MTVRIVMFPLVLATTVLSAQVSNPTGVGTVDSHVAAAKAAAGPEYDHIFHLLCDPPEPASSSGAGRASGGNAAASQAPRVPDRATWHAEPVKVFDNLYWLGQTEYSVWAVTTSDGIIVVDTIYGYSVEDEVVGGLKKLGMDPSMIKYAIVSHGHADHSGGAKFLQEHFGTHVLLSAADWDLLDKSPEPKPTRDMVITDGMKLTLGDATLTMYLTPGHTQGTVSTLIPVKDNGKPHLVALWGGTLFNWLRNRGAYITAATPDTYWFENYSTSARKFREIVQKTGADIILSNHTDFDGSKQKLPGVSARKSGDPNPYVVGNASVRRYLTVADECAKAGLLRVARR
jgi:metallo-beta-lactamase class B